MGSEFVISETNEFGPGVLSDLLENVDGDEVEQIPDKETGFVFKKMK